MALRIPSSELRLLIGLLRRPKAGHRYAEQVTPAVPAGELVDLPGRGNAFVRLLDGPTDALPVVLLHGWTWNADLNFSGVYEPLAEHHRVIAPDVRGHGRSARATGPWRTEDATDDVIALLDELGIQRAILCGFSMGGVIAVDAALRYPDRVAGIVVQAAAACYTTTFRDRAICRLLTLLWPVARSGRMPALTARGYADSLHRSESLRQRWDWVQEELARMTMAEVLAVAQEVLRADLRTELLTPPGCPAEYTVLTRDRLCRPALQRELARLVEATEAEVPADHDLPIVEPGAYGYLTVAAIQRVAARVEPASKAS